MALPGYSERVEHGEELFGLFKARPTGVLIDKDTMEVQIGAHTLPATAMYPFGREHMPSQKWLAKYRNQITVWVMFEEGYIQKAVWCGWSWIEGRNTDQYSLPDGSVTRYIHFHEVVDDSDAEQSWSMLQIDGNKQFIKILKNAMSIYAVKYDLKVKGTATTDAKKIVEKSEDIMLGGDMVVSPAVLGDKLNTNLGQLLNANNSLLTLLQTYGNVQATAAAATTVTAGLAPGYTALVAGLPAIVTSINTIITNLQAQLSQTVKLK
jgi:hypothetical protein